MRTSIPALALPLLALPLLALLALATPARADVPSNLDPNESCVVEQECPERGTERFDNGPATAHVDAEMAAQGLERRCTREMTAGREGGRSTMVVYCPREASGCGACAVGAPRASGGLALFLLGLLGLRR